MKNLIAYRKSTTLKKVLSFIIAITFMIVWLPFVRCIFDGESYQWGAEYFGQMVHGKGVDGSFIFLVFQLAIYVALFYSIYWVRNRIWFYVMLAIWFINVFGNQIAEILINGGTMFHGDTLNVHISVTWIIIPLSIIALLLVIIVIREDINAKEVEIPWNAKNRFYAWVILGPLPLQALLLSMGEPHATTDEIGVVISIVQCFLIALIYRPYPSKIIQTSVA